MWLARGGGEGVVDAVCLERKEVYTLFYATVVIAFAVVSAL
jgi:hypothetical protein